MEWITASPEETMAVGEEIGLALLRGSVVCLYGELGGGKTTLIKGIVRGVTKCAIEEVSSPTFVYLHIYDGVPKVYHFDLYRLCEAQEIIDLGLEEFFYASEICCIEWADRIEQLLPERRIEITLYHAPQGKRKIVWKET